MDAFDKASELETKQREMAIASCLSSHKNQTMEKQSAEECLECDKAIPKARQEAVKGCQYCVTCQELADKGGL